MKNYSKAKTLAYLKGKSKHSKVLPYTIFSANDNLKEVAKRVSLEYNSKVIIRSSSSNEDCEDHSNAGLYKSILNVDILNTEEIILALKEVVNSFDRYSLDKDEILVQPMLEKVLYSGVVFSCDMDTLSSYYIVNYDSSGKTNSVTDGKGKELKTYIEFKQTNKKRNNKFLDLLINSIKELEIIFDNNFIDVEFAYDGKDIYIFQVRPVVKKNKKDLSTINLEKALFKLYKKIKKLNIPHPNLLGDYTMFGVMPDWNPAEIIGKKPKELSLSLYKELITDNIWAYQRNNYGYRDLRSHPLLVSFLGVAYIDIRVSFNSFIPKKLNNKTASKLVNYYLDTLKSNPSRHDKIEFDVILSCLDFSTEDKLKSLSLKGFSTEEIKEIKNSLLGLTNNIFDFYKKDLINIEILKIKYDDIVNSKLSIIDKIYWLNENCKQYGTLPFSGLARAAFVSISFLNSFVEKNIITKNEQSEFLNSLNTISKKLNIDFQIFSKEEFLKVYGHLRPGTYEITSQRYDESYERYFSNTNIKVENTEFKFKKKSLELIEKHLEKNKIKLSAKELIDFISKSIESREYSKFVFTKSLSKILSLVEELGNKYLISKENMSYLDYRSILSLYSSLEFDDIKILFENIIEKNKKAYLFTEGIKLPDLLKDEEEVYSFFNFQTSANYVTLNRVESNLVKEEDIYKKDLNDKIICIKSADPGYDFLFTKNIAALVTCYGGVNSHMAIRCAELNIPAVIGIGEEEYLDLNKYEYILIDCEVQKLKKIR
jgi:phosphoenolpyruvate synthase/pyruvate phosphate dikinase